MKGLKTALIMLILVLGVSSRDLIAFPGSLPPPVKVYDVFIKVYEAKLVCSKPCVELNIRMSEQQLNMLSIDSKYHIPKINGMRHAYMHAYSDKERATMQSDYDALYNKEYKLIIESLTKKGVKPIATNPLAAHPKFATYLEMHQWFFKKYMMLRGETLPNTKDGWIDRHLMRVFTDRNIWRDGQKIFMNQIKKLKDATFMTNRDPNLVFMKENIKTDTSGNTGNTGGPTKTPFELYKEQQCQHCQEGCNVTAQGYRGCKTCKTNYLQSYEEGNIGRCVAQCKTYFEKRGNEVVCVPSCDASNGYSVVPKLLGATSAECIKCSNMVGEGCEKCQLFSRGPISMKVCLKCLDKNYLVSNPAPDSKGVMSYCTTKCPAGQQPLHGLCLKCNDDCADGHCVRNQTKVQCTKCKTKLLANGDCVDKCATNYMEAKDQLGNRVCEWGCFKHGGIDLDTMKCYTCRSYGCVSCKFSKGVEMCQMCGEGKVVQYTDQFPTANSRMTCQPSCRISGQYPDEHNICVKCNGYVIRDPKTGVPTGCKECPTGCEQCRHNTANPLEPQCSRCSKGFFYFQYKCHAKCPIVSKRQFYGYNGQCVSMCPRGWGSIDTNSECYRCPNNCATCHGQAIMINKQQPTTKIRRLMAGEPETEQEEIDRLISNGQRSLIALPPVLNPQPPSTTLKLPTDVLYKSPPHLKSQATGIEFYSLCDSCANVHNMKIIAKAQCIVLEKCPAGSFAGPGSRGIVPQLWVHCMTCKDNEYNYQTGCVPCSQTVPGCTKCGTVDGQMKCSQCEQSRDMKTLNVNGMQKVICSEPVIKCQEGEYRRGKQCLKDCNSGIDTKVVAYTANPVKVCLKCTSGCLSCAYDADANGMNTCLKCADPKKVIQSGNCQVSCMQGYAATSENICKKCEASCNGGCIPGDKPGTLQCKDCADGLVRVSGKCLKDPCGNDPLTYFDDKQKKCVPCGVGCSSCKKVGDKHECVCTKSYLGVTTLKDGSKQQQCFRNCPEGTFTDRAKMVCTPCQPGCKWCQSAKEGSCTSCKEGFALESETISMQAKSMTSRGPIKDVNIAMSIGMNRMMKYGKCIDPCAKGYRKVEHRFNPKLMCLPCQEGCDTCDEYLKCASPTKPTPPSKTQCPSTCKKGCIDKTTTCVECKEAPGTVIFREKDGACTQLQCSSTGANCVGCALLDAKMVNSLYCNKCKDGYKTVGIPPKCVEDLKPTEQKPGEGFSGTNTCKSNQVMSVRGKCEAKCPDKEREGPDKKCLVCPYNADKCTTDVIGRTVVLQCADKFLAVGDKCDTKCPAKSANDPRVNWCQQCPSYCATCKGRVCLTCTEGNLVNGECKIAQSSLRIRSMLPNYENGIIFIPDIVNVLDTTIDPFKHKEWHNTYDTNSKAYEQILKTNWEGPISMTMEKISSIVLATMTANSDQQNKVAEIYTNLMLKANFNKTLFSDISAGEKTVNVLLWKYIWSMKEQLFGLFGDAAMIPGTKKPEQPKTKPQIPQMPQMPSGPKIPIPQLPSKPPPFLLGGKRDLSLVPVPTKEQVLAQLNKKMSMGYLDTDKMDGNELCAKLVEPETIRTLGMTNCKIGKQNMGRMKMTTIMFSLNPKACLKDAKVNFKPNLFYTESSNTNVDIKEVGLDLPRKQREFKPVVTYDQSMGYCSKSYIDILKSKGVGYGTTIVATVVSVTNLKGQVISESKALITAIQNHFNTNVFDGKDKGQERWVIDYTTNKELVILKTLSVQVDMRLKLTSCEGFTHTDPINLVFTISQQSILIDPPATFSYNPARSEPIESNLKVSKSCSSNSKPVKVVCALYFKKNNKWMKFEHKNVEQYCIVPKALSPGYEWKMVHQVPGINTKETLLEFPKQNCKVNLDLIPRTHRIKAQRDIEIPDNFALCELEPENTKVKFAFTESSMGKISYENGKLSIMMASKTAILDIMVNNGAAKITKQIRLRGIGATSVQVLQPRKFFMKLKQSKSDFVTAGDALKLAVRAYDIEGKKVAGVKVDVQLFKTDSNYVVPAQAQDIWQLTKVKNVRLVSMVNGDLTLDPTHLLKDSYYKLRFTLSKKGYDSQTSEHNFRTKSHLEISASILTPTGKIVDPFTVEVRYLSSSLVDHQIKCYFGKMMKPEFKTYSLKSIVVQKGKSAHFNQLFLDEGVNTYEARCETAYGEKATATVKATVSKATQKEKEDVENKLHEDIVRGCDTSKDISCSVKVAAQLAKRFKDNPRMQVKIKKSFEKQTSLKDLDEICANEDVEDGQSASCVHFLKLQAGSIESEIDNDLKGKKVNLDKLTDFVKALEANTNGKRSGAYGKPKDFKIRSKVATVSRQVDESVRKEQRDNMVKCNGMLAKVSKMMRQGKNKVTKDVKELHQLLVKKVMKMEQQLAHQVIAQLAVGAEMKSENDGHSEFHKVLDSSKLGSSISLTITTKANVPCTCTYSNISAEAKQNKLSLSLTCRDQNHIEPSPGCPVVDVSGPSQDCTLQKIDEQPNGDIVISEMKDPGSFFVIEVPKPAAKPNTKQKLMHLDENNPGSCFSSSGTSGSKSSHLTYFTYASIFDPIINPSPNGKETTSHNPMSNSETKLVKNYYNMIFSVIIIMFTFLYFATLLISNKICNKKKDAKVRHFMDDSNSSNSVIPDNDCVLESYDAKSQSQAPDKLNQSSAQLKLGDQSSISGRTKAKSNTISKTATFMIGQRREKSVLSWYCTAIVRLHPLLEPFMFEHPHNTPVAVGMNTIYSISMCLYTSLVMSMILPAGLAVVATLLSMFVLIRLIRALFSSAMSQNNGTKVRWTFFILLLLMTVVTQVGSVLVSVKMTEDIEQALAFIYSIVTVGIFELLVVHVLRCFYQVVLCKFLVNTRAKKFEMFAHPTLLKKMKIFYDR